MDREQMIEVALDAAVVALGRRETGRYLDPPSGGRSLRVGPADADLEMLTKIYGEDGVSDWRDDARTVFTAALAALEAAGVVMVPEKATDEMQAAGYELMGAGSSFVYTAMLAARPK